ncbi:hypothetical protein OUZ56_021348 [Daphnia magna]|uniref:Uncharacterized protein n=1 Tax=Daphnia magna TaxID=35525 RepID=A0ABQ9ZH65_9CRUS|nr:hypothetical protein OUZ56_021348 [Daphnia magna]
MPDICRRMSPICDGYGRPTKPKYLQLPTEVASRCIHVKNWNSWQSLSEEKKKRACIVLRNFKISNRMGAGQPATITQNKNRLEHSRLGQAGRTSRGFSLSNVETEKESDAC